MEKTKYRTVSNGYWEFLQYLVVTKFLCFKFEKWHDVLKPFYNRIWGRSDCTGSCLYINSLRDNPDVFVKQYPCIDKYLKWYEDEQAKLEENARAETEKINKNKETVKYFC